MLQIETLDRLWICIYTRVYNRDKRSADSVHHVCTVLDRRSSLRYVYARLDQPSFTYIYWSITYRYRFVHKSYMAAVGIHEQLHDRYIERLLRALSSFINLGSLQREAPHSPTDAYRQLYTKARSIHRFTRASPSPMKDRRDTVHSAF